MVNTLPLPQEFVTLRQAMDRLVNDRFGAGPLRTVWARSGALPNGATTSLPLDVYATPDAFVIIAAVPGLGPDDLEITVNQGTLVLSGAFASAAEAEGAKGATWYLHELRSGQFRRALTLPFEVDAARADATFEYGTVKITLPKAEAAKPRVIPVRVAGGTEAIAASTQSE